MVGEFIVAENNGLVNAFLRLVSLDRLWLAHHRAFVSHFSKVFNGFLHNVGVVLTLTSIVTVLFQVATIPRWVNNFRNTAFTLEIKPRASSKAENHRHGLRKCATES